MEWFRKLQKKRRVRREVEADFRETFDRTADQQERKGQLRLTEAERTGLMGLAVRWGLFWTFLFVAVQLFAEGLILWSTGTWSENALLNFLLVPPILFFGVFFYLRRKYLNRADSIWQRVRQREVDLEVQRRMKAA